MLSPNSTAWLDPPDNSCLLTGVWIFSLQAVISIIFILCQPFKIFRFIFGHSQMWCLISDLISIFRLQTVNEHRSHYPFSRHRLFQGLCAGSPQRHAVNPELYSGTATGHRRLTHLTPRFGHQASWVKGCVLVSTWLPLVHSFVGYTWL